MKAIILACSICICGGLAFAQDGTNAPAAKPDKHLTPAEARAVVEQCYREILFREADPSGLETHVDLMVKNGYGKEWMRTVLLGSSERVEVLKRRKRNRIILAGVGGGLAIVVIGTVLAARRKRRQ